MTIMREISTEAQRQLAREAAMRGVAVPALAASLPEEAVARSPATKPTQRTALQIRAWLDSLTGFSDQIPALPRETFSRSMIYQDHD